MGATGLFAARWFHPLLDLSVRALPHAYRSVEAAIGTCIAMDIEGSGTWSLVREATGWAVCKGEGPEPDTTISLDPNTAWKTLYHAIRPEEARSRAHVQGDASLALPFFRARSVMVSAPDAE